MSESTAARRWGLLAAEAVLIVLSILLAFAIDAWWGGRQEARDELRLLQGFAQDLRIDSAVYAGVRQSYPAAAEAHRDLLGWLSGEGPELDAGEAVRAARSSILLPILFSKETTTYEEAVQVGGLARLEDRELRRALIEYYSVPFVMTNDVYVEGWLDGVYFPFERALRTAMGPRYVEVMDCGTQDDACLAEASRGFDPGRLWRARDHLVPELSGVATYSRFWLDVMEDGARSRSSVAGLVNQALAERGG